MAISVFNITLNLFLFCLQHFFLYLQVSPLKGILKSAWISFKLNTYMIDYTYRCQLDCEDYKSDNLQYNTLVRWIAGTNDSSTKCLMFQALFFLDFLQTQSRVSTIWEILEILKRESISLKFWLKIFGKLVSDLL